MTAAKAARNHHWVAQCYLKQFARPVSKNGYLWAYDLRDDRSFKPKPKNVAAQRDFNRFDAPGQVPDALESALSEFEYDLDHAIKETVASDTGFPSNDARELILNFIALLAVRNPRFREQRRKFREEISRTTMNLILASPERYKATMKRALEAGAIDEIPPYEMMKESEDREKYIVEVPREKQIIEEFDIHDHLLQILSARHWSIVRSTEATGEFVTTDHPVVLVQNQPTRRPLPLGFGLKIATVYFALGKYACIVGEFENLPEYIAGDAIGIAGMNTDIIMSAERQVYASNPSKFQFHDPSSDLIRLLSGNELSAKILKPNN